MASPTARRNPLATFLFAAEIVKERGKLGLG